MLHFTNFSYICFVLFQFVFIFNMIQYQPVTIDKYRYPGWADGLGWVLALFPLVWIAASMIWKIRTLKDDNMTLWQVGNKPVVKTILLVCRNKLGFCIWSHGTVSCIAVLLSVCVYLRPSSCVTNYCRLSLMIGQHGR